LVPAAKAVGYERRRPHGLKGERQRRASVSPSSKQRNFRSSLPIIIHAPKMD